MRRLPRLARHTGIYVAVPVAVRALAFALVPVFTRFLTPAEYGAWGYVTVAATTLGSVAPLGLFTAYLYALRRPEVASQPAASVRRAALQTAFLIMIAAGLLGFWGLRRIKLGLSHPDRVWVVVLGATVLGSLVQAGKRRYQMLERPRDYVRVEIVTGLLVAAASLVAVVILDAGVLGLAWGVAAGTAGGLIVSGGSLGGDLMGRVPPAARRAALRFGFPLFVHTTAATVLQYVDRFMLERMSTLDELGFYSLAGQIGTAMLVITTSTNQAYVPFLYRHHESGGEVVRRGRRYVAAFFVVVGLVGMALTGPFIHRFVDPRFTPALGPAQILIAAGILHGFYFLEVGRLVVSGRTKAIAYATVAATVLNIFLNLLLIPHRQAEGAAWATLLSEGFLFAAVWWAARRGPSERGERIGADLIEAGG